VTIGSAGGLGASLGDSVTLGIIVGLVVGKPVGVLGVTWLVQRFTRARLGDGLGWADLLGLALVAGIGFTVSLLIGELAFGAGSERDEHVKIGVLSGRSSPLCSPRSCCVCATDVTGASVRRRNATRTPTASPTSTRRTRPGTDPDQRAATGGRRVR
jgi:Na+/H+ antiporter 1